MKNDFNIIDLPIIEEEDSKHDICGVCSSCGACKGISIKISGLGHIAALWPNND